jgi:hypothetical protein
MIPRKANHYHVYVVELDPSVLGRKKFAERNPDHIPGKPCVYVGMTGLTPEKRFANHKRGYKANRYVRDYGWELRPDLYPDGSPFTYKEAQSVERDVARELRAIGYAVWQE